MPNNEGDLSERSKNMAIVIENVLKMVKHFPKKLAGIGAAISIILTVISSIFEYDKIGLNTIFNLPTLIKSLKILYIFFVFLLIKTYYSYVDKTEKIMSNIKQALLKSNTNYSAKLELIKQQNMAQPIFMNKDLIKNMICEIENYVNLKTDPEIIEKYLSVLEIKLVNNNIIEITASNKDNFFIAKRIIFEIWFQKNIKGHFVYDSYGLVTVIECSEDCFKSILIDTEPENDYWEKMIVDSSGDTCKRAEDFYLKIYVPEDVSRTNKDTLDNLLEGLNKL